MSAEANATRFAVYTNSSMVIWFLKEKIEKKKRKKGRSTIKMHKDVNLYLLNSPTPISVANVQVQSSHAEAEWTTHVSRIKR